jgi:hypothetical protein
MAGNSEVGIEFQLRKCSPISNSLVLRLLSSNAYSLGRTFERCSTMVTGQDATSATHRVIDRMTVMCHAGGLVEECRPWTPRLHCTSGVLLSRKLLRSCNEWNFETQIVPFFVCSWWLLGRVSRRDDGQGLHHPHEEVPHQSSTLQTAVRTYQNPLRIKIIAAATNCWSVSSILHDFGSVLGAAQSAASLPDGFEQLRTMLEKLIFRLSLCRSSM